MPLAAAQKQAIEEVVNAITTATAPKGKRLLSAMFMSLVDPKEWPEYYEVCPFFARGIALHCCRLFQILGVSTTYVQH